MLRAPIWNMSAYRSTSSTWRGSMTSVTTGMPSCSPAAWRIFSPSSPSPWKLYGLVRGLNAPPRRMLAPASLTHPGDLEEQRLALDRARAGDHRQVAAADLHPLDLERPSRRGGTRGWPA